MSEGTKKTDPIDKESELQDTDLEQMAGGSADPILSFSTKKDASGKIYK